MHPFNNQRHAGGSPRHRPFQWNPLGREAQCRSPSARSRPDGPVVIERAALDGDDNLVPGGDDDVHANGRWSVPGNGGAAQRRRLTAMRTKVSTIAATPRIIHTRRLDVERSGEADGADCFSTARTTLASRCSSAAGDATEEPATATGAVGMPRLDGASNVSASALADKPPVAPGVGVVEAGVVGVGEAGVGATGRGRSKVMCERQAGQ